MKLKYKSSRKIDPQQILELYKSVNWVKKNEGLKTGKSIVSAYENSQVVISCWDNTKLIGIVRALTDKKVNGVIFGLVVHKDYQMRSIGKELLDRCIEKYPKIIWYLWAGNSGAEGFYKKINMNATSQILFEKKPTK